MILKTRNRRISFALAVVIGLILLAVMLSGCSARYHLRQAVKKGATVKADTVYKEVRVTVPEIRVDTLVKNVVFNDTIVVKKDSVITKIKVNVKENTVYVQTECPERTVVVRHPVIITKKIDAPPCRCKWRWWHVALGTIGGLLMGAILIKVFR